MDHPRCGATSPSTEILANKIDKLANKFDKLCEMVERSLASQGQEPMPDSPSGGAEPIDGEHYLDLVLDEQTRTATRGGKEVTFWRARQQWAVLLLCWRQRGRCLTTEALTARAWTSCSETSRPGPETVERTVGRLNQRIRILRIQIKNVPGQGRFLAELDQEKSTPE
jgi:DNA-binding response OmpR family regulator